MNLHFRAKAVKRLLVFCSGISVMLFAINYGILRECCTRSSVKVQRDVISTPGLNIAGETKTDADNTAQDKILTQETALENEFMLLMEMRMRERRDLLQEKCKSLGLVDEEPKRVKFVLSENYKLAYCFIPKTGCTNWKKVIMVLNGYADSYEELDKISHDHLHGIVARNYLVDSIGEPPSIRNFTKFLVVRDPYERLVSSYRNKIAKQSNNEKPQYYKISEEIRMKYSNNRTVLKRRKRSEASFGEFVKFLIDGNNDNYSVMENHWANYNRICSVCSIKYDVIAHLETIHEDSRYLLKLLGAPEDVQLPSGYNKLGTSVVNADSVSSYYKNLTPLKLKQLYDAYIGDFQLFGYPFRDSWDDNA